MNEKAHIVILEEDHLLKDSLINKINNGEIIEQYPEDFPFPSCLILGKTYSNQWIHLVMSDEGSMSRVITAYYPDKEKWTEDFRTRKEK